MLISIFLNILYFIVLLCIIPWIMYSVIIKGKYKDTIMERLGNISHIPEQGNCIWVHGVSVGEIKAAKPLILRLKQYTNANIIISSTSSSGKKIAKEIYADFLVISFPIDFSFSIQKYFQKFSPQLIVLMELEIWPNFLFLAKKKDIPVILINGRLSDKSFRRYSRYLKIFFPWITSAIKLFSVQTNIYKERFEKLGIKSENIHITGNMKYDDVTYSENKDIRDVFGISKDMQVFVAGSTHDPEERIIIDNYSKIVSMFPSFRLIIVPRHPKRSNQIADYIRQSGFIPIKQSEIKSPVMLESKSIIIGDIMGTLRDIYSLASIAFVGGSLIPHGGQNFIEPASFGKAVICGPYMENFPDVVSFLQENALIQIQNKEDLHVVVTKLFRDKEYRKQIGERAKKIVENSKGSADKNLQLCIDILENTL